MVAARDPRANQKERTRAAIVEAAAALLRSSGTPPSVADAAEAAKVSRATAYRYFPTPEALHLEIAGVTPTYAPIDELVQKIEGDDIEERLTRFLSELNSITFEDEAQLRMALKVYLDTWFASRAAGVEAPPLREGRRMRWLERVLEPARRGMTAKQWRRMQAAIALTVGTDAMVILKDVCRLEDEEAKEVLLWAARALLRAALDESGGATARFPKATPRPSPRRSASRRK